MKKAALYLCFVVLLVSLLIGCDGGGVVPPPPEEAEKFVGLWVNEDQGPNIYIARCRIELTNRHLYIDLWARISQTGENYIGQQVIAVEEAGDGVIEISQTDNFGTYVSILSLLNNKLKIDTTFSPFNPEWHVMTITDYLKKVE